MWFWILRPKFPSSQLCNLLHIYSLTEILSLTGCRNNLPRTNYLWPTLWSSSSSVVSARGVTPLWHWIVVIFVFTVTFKRLSTILAHGSLCRPPRAVHDILNPFSSDLIGLAVRAWTVQQEPPHPAQCVWLALPEQALISSALNEVRGCSRYI